MKKKPGKTIKISITAKTAERGSMTKVRQLDKRANIF